MSYSHWTAAAAGLPLVSRARRAWRLRRWCIVVALPVLHCTMPTLLSLRRHPLHTAAASSPALLRFYSSLLRRRLRSHCDNSFLQARMLPMKGSHSKSCRRQKNCCLDGRSPLLSVQLRRCWITTILSGSRRISPTLLLYHRSDTILDCRLRI